MIHAIPKNPETFFHAHLFGHRVEEVRGIFNLSNMYSLVLHKWINNEVHPRRERKQNTNDAYFKTKSEALGWLVNIYTERVVNETQALQASNAILEKITKEYLEAMHEQAL